MISLVYVSRATRPFHDEDIAALLRQSRESNARHGLTGLLLYQKLQFMQVLEGEEEDVVDLYESIAADPRHTDVRTLLTTTIRQRRFSEWSMGYRAVSDESIRQIPGYDGFLDHARGSDRTWTDPSRAQWLLDWFRLRTR